MVYFGGNILGKFSRSPPASSFDFEEYWEEVLKRSAKKGFNEIVLILDDLDRCKPSIVNEIFGKINTIVKKAEKKGKPTLSVILPFSLEEYLSLRHDNKEVEQLKNDYRKFFDVIMEMPKLGQLELQKLQERKTNGKKQTL